MKLGYNTNGLAFHRWTDGLVLLAEQGYRSVAITLDHCCLDPYSANLPGELQQMSQLLGQLGLSCVVETGARYLLNPRVKHDPTLLSAGEDERALRLDFLKRSVDIAVELQAEAVSFWSGILRDPISGPMAWNRLAEGCRQLAEYAGERGMRLAFEPEPGMFIESFAQFARLAEMVDSPVFGLTVDIGHVHCVEDGPLEDYLREWAPLMYNVHIEDMFRGVHEHLRFGEGDIAFAPVMQTLAEIGYTGGVHVELSRHSHMAPVVLKESFEFLSQYVPDEG